METIAVTVVAEWHGGAQMEFLLKATLPAAF